MTNIKKPQFFRWATRVVFVLGMAVACLPSGPWDDPRRVHETIREIAPCFLAVGLILTCVAIGVRDKVGAVLGIMHELVFLFIYFIGHYQWKR